MIHSMSNASKARNSFRSMSSTGNKRNNTITNAKTVLSKQKFLGFSRRNPLSLYPKTTAKAVHDFDRDSEEDVNRDDNENENREQWEDDYGDDSTTAMFNNGTNDDDRSATDWRTQMKVQEMMGLTKNLSTDRATTNSKREDADDDGYFMKPATQFMMNSDFSSAGPNEDVWFDNGDDWFQPAYTEVTAEPGSILEKVQRLHLGEPASHNFEDGEYFALTNYVKQKADNNFCLVMEVAERARERKIERLESLHPTPEINALPEIQQAIVDLALEIDASGGKASAYMAMFQAADGARLRWELQEASWCWDNWIEQHMAQFGVSERAAELLHMGVKLEDEMDFEKSLNQKGRGGFGGGRQ